MADATYLRNLLMHPGFDVGCLVFNFLFTKYPPLFLQAEEKEPKISISVQFWSKEQGMRVKDRTKKGASKRVRREWGRNEGNACRQTLGFLKPCTWPVMPECAHPHLMLPSSVIN